MANGVQGLMIWGKETLCLTVGRAGFWDHRGGKSFLPRGTYKDVRRLAGDLDGEALVRLFSPGPRSEHHPKRPQQYGCGRIELDFGVEWALVEGQLFLKHGEVVIELQHRTDPERTAKLTIQQVRFAELIRVVWDGDLVPKIVSRPTWESVGKEMEKLAIQPPRVWQNGNDSGGFHQSLPEDDGLALAWQKAGSGIFVATALGSDPVPQAEELSQGKHWEFEHEASRLWWNTYWEDVSRVYLPDADLQELYDYGVYRQAGLTPPEGLPATLQGPWMEDTRIPPWSNDFHFNINVQLIYGPCLPSNRPDHLWPLWKLIKGWMPQLKIAGEAFFETPGALMLPHAVDDRGQVVGTFWAGTIDHACIAWMGLLAWQHYRHTLECEVLEEIAWPLLQGTFVGYRAMLEWREEPGETPRWSLPVSVSPEFGGSDVRQCQGRDASFQLAALHRTLEILPQAAEVLGRAIDPDWKSVQENLPPYTVVNFANREWEKDRLGIGLWENQPLHCSHRHHSHLASLHPFDSLDPKAPEHWDIVKESLRNWIETGPGRWSGWCVPWASMICSKVGMVDMAAWWLKTYKAVYTNIGRGPLHDANISGFSLLDSGLSRRSNYAHLPEYEKHEIIQLDGALGSATAILEMLVRNSRGVVHVLSKLPEHWDRAACDGVLVEGAFLVDARWEKGALVWIRIQSKAGGTLKLRHGWSQGCLKDTESFAGEILEIVFTEGEALELLPIP